MRRVRPRGANWLLLAVFALVFAVASCGDEVPLGSPSNGSEPESTDTIEDEQPSESSSNGIDPEPTDTIENEPPEEPWGPGDDPYLDGLWDGCAAGDAAACDELYFESPIGSEYEAFGDTCAGLSDGGGCPETSSPPTVTEPEFTEYAQITTWYLAAEADNSAWVHFKAVDDDGFTVNEVLGSDLLNLVDEAEAMDQTPERVELVDELRQMMADGGWTEIGVNGDWYEYAFGR
jgi:hypothetical protein